MAQNKIGKSCKKLVRKDGRKEKAAGVSVSRTI
jgi:hypothetical protein